MKKKLLQFGLAASVVAVGLGVLVGVKSTNTFIQKTDADNNKIVINTPTFILILKIYSFSLSRCIYYTI